MRTILLCFSAALALCPGASGPARGQDDAERATADLPPPPAGAAEYPARTPGAPFERIGGQNAAMRTIFQGPGPDNSRIEIREIIVGPRADVELPPMPGPALVDPRSGAGSMKAGERSEALATANTVAVAAGVPLALSNSADVPLVVKLYVVEAR